MKQVLLQVCIRGHFNNDTTQNTVSLFLLSKLLYLIGHIAIKEMVHLDMSVYKELKRRDIVRNLKKEKKSDKNEKDINIVRRSKIEVSTPNSARQIILNKEVMIYLKLIYIYLLYLLYIIYYNLLFFILDKLNYGR